ncbi:hypothetical protein D3C77_456580 [compost metagenome]
MHQCCATSQTRRALDEGQVVKQGIFQVSELPTRTVVVEHPFLLRSHQREAAVALHRCFRSTPDHIDTAITGDVVPQRLDAILGNGKRHAAISVTEPVTAFEQLRRGGVLESVVVQPLRCRAGAAAGVHRHLEGVGVAVEQRDLARTQLVLVLVQIGLGNGEQRFIRRERVQVMFARHIALRGLGETAVPGRDGPGGVTRALGAHGRQGGFQLLGLLGRNGGQRPAGRQAQDQRQGGLEQSWCVKHGCSPH